MDHYHSNNDCIIHPRRGKGEKRLPATGLLLPNPQEARFTAGRVLDSGGEKRSLFHSTLTVDAAERYFVAGPAVGAPMAVICFEKLVALGAKRIIVVSCCGSLDKEIGIGDLVCAKSTLSGEGTSNYYCEDDCGPDDHLVKDLQRFLDREQAHYYQGKIWSTDAPFRESRSHLKVLHEDFDVISVDMEFSALCAAAVFRKISVAGLFVVSDLLWGNSWKPGFGSKPFRYRSESLIKNLLESGLSFPTG